MKRIILGAAGLSLLLTAGAMAAETRKGVDAHGRHYVLTLTGKLAKKDLPPNDTMEHAASDVGAYMLKACDAPGLTRCELYAGYDSKLNLPPGYVVAMTGSGKTSYRPEFMNRAGPAPRYSCLAQGKPMPADMTGKDVLEGRGPVVLLRDGPGVRLAYNKAFGCKLEIDDRFDLIGTMVFN